MSDDSEWEPYLADVQAFQDAKKTGKRPLHHDGRPFTDEEIQGYQAADDLISGILNRHGLMPPRKAPKRRR